MRVLSSLLVIVFLFNINCLQAQNLRKATKPKLVVGLVIDQMRWDYLYRYNSRYSAGGFKRLMQKGFSFENTNIPYIPTVTAAGHACIYTGAVPATNGIVGNAWYNKLNKKYVYCTDDSTVHGIGNDDAQGKMSPKNNEATTIGDELRLATNFRSKVIGIALKDRGSILPAGHTANASYWYDEETGKWITSSHYMNALPTWVNSFNDKDYPTAYMKQEWKTLFPIETYIQSSKDENNQELNFPELNKNYFPYNLAAVTKKPKDYFKLTPYSNTYTFDFAKAAIENEKLGQNNETDLLAISISTTDYVGHSFGPNSVEIEDLYLRLDLDIANFLNYLDKKLGLNNYTVFLSADHGVAHAVNFLKENKLPSNTINNGAIQNELKKMLVDSFAINPILDIQNFQVYIDYDFIQKKGIDENKIIKFIIQHLKKKSFVQDAFETSQWSTTSIAEPIKTRGVNGYYPARSGDIQIVCKPNSSAYREKGTGHTMWNPYDAHIPLIFYGWGIKPGKTYREVYMTDIAPTLAALLNIQTPSGNVGSVLKEIVP
jgi:predicted AlkP superfamily pyrophosphatase or phosphodiesterase